MALTAISGHSADGPKNGIVLLIRHAEKPNDGAGLSLDGQKRAQAYPKYFQDFTIDGKPLKLSAIFAAADSDSSVRPRLTVEPLAKTLGLRVNDDFKTKDLRDLAKALKNLPAGETVLVCWRHGEIPELLHELGAKPKELLADGDWPEHVYDWVIQLRYDRKGNLLGAKRINEHLMPSDNE